MRHFAIRSIPVLALALALGACGDSPAPEARDGATPAPPAAGPDVAPARFAEYTQGPAAAAGHCSLDAINGGSAQGVSLPAGAEVMFGGWVVDADRAAPPVVQLVLRGETSYALPFSLGGERPDVAQALNSELARFAGFNIATRLDGIAPGEYALEIVHGDGGGATCSLQSTLSVTGG
jgi:hypothetical protein